MKHVHFIDEEGSFLIERPENTSCLYLPLASETGLKSSITPNLGGDSKTDQETFLLEPVSAENLHNNRSTRNFWIVPKEAEPYSVSGASARQEALRFQASQDDSELTAGFMWQSLKRSSRDARLTTTATSFIPREQNVEVLYVTVENCSGEARELTAYAAIPIYGRGADHIRDHRNVTSLLHRIEAAETGVFVSPTMSFDERGHHPNEQIYYVMGCTGDGKLPEGFFPTVEDFLGEGGTYTHPRAVYEGAPGFPAPYRAAGKEAMGAFRFAPVTLAPGETMDYIVLLGTAKRQEDISAVFAGLDQRDKIQKSLEDTKNYWQKNVSIRFHTGERSFDRLMRWVCFQPFLRRLFGCSFLPHHDYGRGGRGWRDLWQDCLSLLLSEPENVGQMIVKNFAGVRMDGTNATIIGSGDGNFLADRNGISRVWMDHALWPLLTTKLYIDQTGDVEILTREVSYFKDAQVMRGAAVDDQWEESCGHMQLTAHHTVYRGSILEHLLIQQLTAFYEVGNHNIYRLRDADWNDALDMASEYGESVAFTCAYAGNLLNLASMLSLLASRSSQKTVELLDELSILLDFGAAREALEDIARKREILNAYAVECRHTVKGKRTPVPLSALVENLIQKADWLMGHLRAQEWIQGPGEEGWFNSYYDNHGRPLEGFSKDGARMMLTGQVFAIMSGTAQDEHIGKIVRSADHYLYKKEIGGYRLNTDFQELKFDMGRMFGFAYGEKENGAVFSHMAVMYANALYQRGFVREGWKALKTLADTALNFDTSHIYPNIPEYFRADGRGMYQYLTGAASWFMLTMTTEVFGVRGKAGDLLLHPRLLASQFDREGTASITTRFAGKEITVVYENKTRKDFGEYAISSATCDGAPLPVKEDTFLLLPRKTIAGLPGGIHRIFVVLL